MKIGIVGLGYVGLVTAACLANNGHSIIGIDSIPEKVEILKSGRVPIFEPGLKEKISAAKNDLVFSTDYADLAGCSAVLLCVPTPNNGREIDLRYVYDAGKSVSNYAQDSSLVIKSTVLPGTARKVSKETGMNVISNPEFTREGSAIHDTEHPDRVVIGGKSTEVVRKIWEFTGAPMLVTTNENAELIKYASNAFLAVKISFINQIADLCERIPNTDVKVIARGMGLDHRIGSEFLRAGLGYGGSCFPKDTIAFTTFAEEKNTDLSIIRSAIEYNDNRIPDLVGKMIEKSNSLSGKRICVLGLSFKDNTDDLRESRSLLLIENLKIKGATVKAFDPAVKALKDVTISSDIEECITSSEIVITATEWNDFADMDPALLKGKQVFDLRRILDPEEVDITMGVGIGKN